MTYVAAPCIFFPFLYSLVLGFALHYSLQPHPVVQPSFPLLSGAGCVVALLASGHGATTTAVIAGRVRGCVKRKCGALGVHTGLVV